MDQQTYFDFLQVAIGAKKSWDKPLSEKDWKMLYVFCKRQTLLGIGFAAVERLHALGATCPQPLLMQWMGLAMKIAKRNELLNKQCKDLTEQYRHDGLHCCILKGQGNLLNYPEHLRLRRQPGDIDLWAIPNAEEGIPIAKQTGKDSTEYVLYQGRRAVREYVRAQHRIAGNFEKVPVRYHHIDAPDMAGTPVEVHFRVGHFAAPLRNARLQRWFNEHAEECMRNDTPMEFAMPTASVNVVYQMTHLFTHYLDEGLGLRQLLDYYYAIKAWRNECADSLNDQKRGGEMDGHDAPILSQKEVYQTICWLGMGKFAAAVMWVLHEVFALPEPYYICEPNAQEGRTLLREIMLAGNFGQHDERGRALKTGGLMKHGVWKLKRIMRLASSYPEEALSEPFFRVYHYFWRLCH